MKEQMAMQMQKSFKDQNETVERTREEDESLGEPTKPLLGKANFFEASGKAKEGKQK